MVPHKKQEMNLLPVFGIGYTPDLSEFLFSELVVYPIRGKHFSET